MNTLRLIVAGLRSVRLAQLGCELVQVPAMLWRRSPLAIISGRLWLCATSPHRGSTGEEVTKLPEGYDVENYRFKSYSEFEDFEPP
jgi:hypothetical protein